MVTVIIRDVNAEELSEGRIRLNAPIEINPGELIMLKGVEKRVLSSQLQFYDMGNNYLELMQWVRVV